MVAETVSESLNRFLSSFASSLDDAVRERVIEENWLCSTEGGDESRLHSRVLGILAKTGFDLNYTVGIEAGFKAGKVNPRKSNYFKPDIQLWKEHKLIFLIEYESANSSDSRIIDKVLDHCYHALNAGRDHDVALPDFWLIIYTLPDCALTKWYHHDYGARTHRTAYNEMLGNPHDFYTKALENPTFLKWSRRPIRWGKSIRAENCHSISKCFMEAGRTRQKVFLINLTEAGLKIDYPKRLTREYPFKSSRSKR